MEISIDTRQLQALEFRLNTVGRSLNKQTLSPALVDAAQPMLTAVRQETPVGPVPRYKSATITRGRNKGGVRRTTGSFARGGATRNSVRLKAVEGVGNEVVRVLAGVSKKRGKVGWRTHFIKKDFVRLAYRRTFEVVTQRFMTSLTKTVDKIINRG